jgi:type IV pilus assembly protein PilQ
MMRVWTDVPESSKRVMRMLACGMGAVLLVAAALPVPNDGAVISLSVVPASSQAHVIIGVDGAVSVKDFALTNPNRIVVDVAGATLGFRKSVYDRVARGGIIDMRIAQNQPDVVRIVLTLTGPMAYEVQRETGAIRVSVAGGGSFPIWRVGKPGLESAAIAKVKAPSDMMSRQVISAAPAPVGESPSGPVALPPPTARVTAVRAEPSVLRQDPNQPPRQQPPITIAWENAQIADVLAQFAAYSGRTIIQARGVTGTITAEIINKPWDVAMRAILNANGFDAQEDENGIIVVNTIENLAARPRYEALTTRTVRFNYTNASSVAASLQSRLSRDCGVQAGSSPSATPSTAAGGQPLPPTLTTVQNPSNCPIRGAVTADTLTNSISITESPSNIDDIVAHALTLDIRQPQVNIKAKIILVDRNQLEELGLKYDLGSTTQHFNDVIARLDSSGAPESGNRVALGGNAISAIANAGVSVGNPTLRIAYSTAIGGFDFTTFLDAVQQVSLLDVQAEPSVTTLNYKTANLRAGTEVPIRTSEPGTGGNAQGNFPQVTVQMRQTGIVLNVTPQVTNNRHVLMRIHAENSDVQFLGGDVGATFPTQSIDNELLVADGETAVMGGLTQTSVRIAKTGLPLLMDLPLIGRLFSHTSRQETKRDLLILITPHIVDEGDMQMSPRRSP